ncbi:MAG: tyrosine decarboxylase MfnA [Euryarchaeota archaeon]|nr:tyrosine decarboxylase MfnA [Euryarchaeota archaeon]
MQNRCGLPEEIILSKLEEMRGKDTPPSIIFSSMCTLPHPIAVRAHNIFLPTNLGDPGLFQGTVALEHEVISWFSTLFQCPQAGGCTTSGGTESNIQALSIAIRQSLHSKPDIRPNIIVPASAHFSFEKARDLLGFELRVAREDTMHRVDPEHVSDLIDEHTCCMVGVAGTTEYGMVDPISELAALAKEHEIFFHVDAAFGGLVLPFLENAPPFDFSLEGVSSICVDPHKMGMSTIPAGVLLVREQEYFDVLSVDTPYLTKKTSFHLTGTRPGAPVASTWAVLYNLGFNGMQEIVQQCMENTHYLIKEMEAAGIMRAVTPDVNVATFHPHRIPDPWVMSHTRGGDVRMVVMPHITRTQIDAYVADVHPQGAKGD